MKTRTKSPRMCIYKIQQDICFILGW